MAITLTKLLNSLGREQLETLAQRVKDIYPEFIWDQSVTVEVLRHNMNRTLRSNPEWMVGVVGLENIVELNAHLSPVPPPRTPFSTTSRTVPVKTVHSLESPSTAVRVEDCVDDEEDEEQNVFVPPSSTGDMLNLGVGTSIPGTSVPVVASHPISTTSSLAQRRQIQNISTVPMLNPYFSQVPPVYTSASMYGSVPPGMFPNPQPGAVPNPYVVPQGFYPYPFQGHPGFMPNPYPSQHVMVPNQNGSQWHQVPPVSNSEQSFPEPSVEPRRGRPGNKINFLKEATRKNLGFSGKPNDDLSWFLTKVDRTLEGFYLEEEDKVSAVCDLLQGDAEMFVESIRGTLSTYESLKRALKGTYLPRHHAADLRRQVLSMKQTSNEKSAHFIAKVRVKNSQSPKPIADSELISIVTANLHPSLFPHLERMDAEITTWQELHDFTLRAETIIELEHRAAKSLNRKMQVLAMDGDDEEVEANVLTCYNCQKPGHKHSECPRPKKFFCHRCGRDGVTSQYCGCDTSKCDQGNVRPRRERQGRDEKRRQP